MVNFVPRTSTRLADAVRAAGASGTAGTLAEPITLLDGTLPPEVPPGVDVVPWHGAQGFESEAARVVLAECLWSEHQPDGHDYRLRLRPPFVARATDRHCGAPGCSSWPCQAARWAAKVLDAHNRGQVTR